MCAIIHHSSYFNYNFILERVEGQNMSTGKRNNSGNNSKQKTSREEKEIRTTFLFSYLRTLSEDHVARLLITHSLNIPILV